MKTYIVSHSEEELGPFTVDEILSQLQAGELSPVDFIYEETLEQWVALMQFSPVAEALAAKSKPKAPPKKSRQIKDQREGPSVSEVKAHKSKAAETLSPEVEIAINLKWFILKAENRFGPFSYSDVLKMLQQKIVFEFDFAWNPKMKTWVRVAELEAFSAETIHQMKETLMPELNEVFFRRKHKRVDFSSSVIVHNNSKHWKGTGIEISASGAGVLIENALLVPGDNVMVHFKASHGLPAFNANCEVVSKKYIEGVQEKTAPMSYGLRFKEISKQMQEALKSFTQQSPSAA